MMSIRNQFQKMGRCIGSRHYGVSPNVGFVAAFVAAFTTTSVTVNRLYFHNQVQCPAVISSYEADPKDNSIAAVVTRACDAVSRGRGAEGREITITVGPKPEAPDYVVTTCRTQRVDQSGPKP